jgi:TetR/AcrR family transcriptional regulator
LKDLVDEKVRLIEAWIAKGAMAKTDAHHLIFSIWATTQHYSDFDVQVQAVLGDRAGNRVADAEQFLTNLYRAALSPKA